MTFAPNGDCFDNGAPGMTRIAWRSLLTGATGHGERAAYDLTEMVECLNREWYGVIAHWVEKREGK